VKNFDHIIYTVCDEIKIFSVKIPLAAVFLKIEISFYHGCKFRGYIRAIAPPRICQEGLNIPQAPKNYEIASHP